MPQPKTSPTPKTTTTNRRGRKPKTESRSDNASALVVPEKPVLDAEIIEDSPSPLTPEEATRLAELEDTVDTSFVQLAEALREIRDKRLYRGEFGTRTFDEYCEERFGFGRRLGFYYANAGEVVANLKGSEQIVHFPTSESQVRVLAKLSAEVQRAVWEKATGKAGGVPSARIVEETVQEIKGPSTPRKSRTPSFSIGDVARVRAGAHEELSGKAGHWGIIEEVSDSTVTITLPDRTVSSVSAHDLEPIELPPKEKKAREGMMTTLQGAHKALPTEKAAVLLIDYFATVKSGSLSSFDQGLLKYLERAVKSSEKVTSDSDA